LQKTLLNIEGLGRQLYPDLDLWTTAQPFLERWMRDRVSPLHLLRNLQQQAEQVPHLSQMARDTLERLNQQPRGNPAASSSKAHWPVRLLGAVLIGGAATQGLLLSLGAWPSWAMLAGGVYLVMRR
jgi:ubiquinone biosynthesis protein